MEMQYDFKQFNSECLCSECGGLLYVNQNDTSQELCINQTCERWPEGAEFINPSEKGSPQLYRELAEAEAELFADIQRCDAKALSLYAGILRNQQAASLIKQFTYFFGGPTNQSIGFRGRFYDFLYFILRRV